VYGNTPYLVKEVGRVQDVGMRSCVRRWYYVEAYLAVVLDRRSEGVVKASARKRGFRVLLGPASRETFGNCAWVLMVIPITMALMMTMMKSLTLRTFFNTRNDRIRSRV